jgi:hypothetical protein
MPKIKPLKKLVSKARDLRESHQERHRPTGFGFALADSVDYLDATHWYAVTATNSLFLSPRYLRVLEKAGPDNLRQRYALIFRGRAPVAAVAAQSVTVSLSRVSQKPRKGKASAPLEKRCSANQQFALPVESRRLSLRSLVVTAWQSVRRSRRRAEGYHQG